MLNPPKNSLCPNCQYLHFVYFCQKKRKRRGFTSLPLQPHPLRGSNRMYMYSRLDLFPHKPVEFQYLVHIFARCAYRCFVYCVFAFSPQFFKRLAYTLTAYLCDATGCFVKALPMGQNIVKDKSYTKQLGQISILEHCKRQ